MGVWNLQILSGQRQFHTLVDKYQVLSTCLCGEIYDSSPTDFTSEQGVRAIGSLLSAPATFRRSMLNVLLNVGACTLDFFLVDIFEAERDVYWSTLGCSPVRGPVLFMYGDADSVLPASLIDDFSKLLKKKGREVWAKKWLHSEHLQHFRNYPEEYTDIVTSFVRRSVGLWIKNQDGECSVFLSLPEAAKLQ